MKSFTLMIVVVDVIVFIVSLLMAKMSTTDFLAPSPDVLDKLGQKDSIKMQKYFQVWRFITPVFLHASFMHIFMNSISTLMIGSGIEASLKFKRTMILYFVSGFGGILFSCVVNPSANAVGASTAIYGMLGYYVSKLF
jgi:rhomboid protease GluP